MPKAIPMDVIGKLRETLPTLGENQKAEKIEKSRELVFARYQPVFSPEKVGEISEEEFRSFLLFENNRHWTGLHRQANKMCADMNLLRKALSILVDENRPVGERLDEAVAMVPGMGKNTATAILLIEYPDRYGVWNARSEAQMRSLGVWPEFEKGESLGSRYVKVNEIMRAIRDALQVSFWTLDTLWWHMETRQEEAEAPNDHADTMNTPEGDQRFGLERHLHEFLRDNWDRLADLGQEWKIYGEPGDEEAGFEYPCDVGRIDILARHKKKPSWLVIELKRDQTADRTVGQLLRYIGWVKEHLAENGEEVRGLIICRKADKALHYALKAIPNVDLRLYEVEFRLRKPEFDERAMGEGSQ